MKMGGGGFKPGPQPGDQRIQRMHQRVTVNPLRVRNGSRPARRVRGGGDPAQGDFQTVHNLGFGFGLGHGIPFATYQTRTCCKVKQMLFPAVIVHGLDDARAALAPGRPVTLLSAPGAALFGGCLWWQSLMAAAGYKGVSLLDCSDAAGRAAEALRLGLPGVVLSADTPAFKVVEDLARDAGALILPAAPPALDLGKNGAVRQLSAWLG